MTTTRSRPRGRESARLSSAGVIAEHAAKIYAVAIGSIVVIVAFLALTSTGRLIDAATQRFMLYYAGVFALIALCASVGLGLVATDRLILNPGHRIFVQAAHRAASFGALVFLIIHIVTEILAQRVHVLDALVPFLSPFRTFYMGLGTIASDLVLLVMITGILRKRFTTNGNAWRWRAIHYTSYVAFIFGVWHGLLGGRTGKPYVDWSYGFVVACVALALAVRILANSLRPRENLSTPPVPEPAGAGSVPMRAASMFAQLSLARAASQSALAAQSGPQTMLSAPVGDWNARSATGPRPALAALPAPYDGRQPFYEPGYEGPPRYLGVPRTGSTGPQPRATTGPMQRAMTGPRPRSATGPQPRADSGPMPRTATGPQPRAATGPQPRAATGPQPRAASRPANGPMPRADSGPMRRAATGPMPHVTTGQQRPNTEPMPQPDARATGIRSRGATPPGRGTGPYPRAASGPAPRVTGPAAGPRTGPMPRAATGPQPRPGTGPAPRGASGPVPRAGTGPMPGAASGPMPRAASGPMPRAATGPMPRSGSEPRRGTAAPSGRRDGTSAGGRRRGGEQSDGGRTARGQASRDTAGHDGHDGGTVDWNYGLPPWDGGGPEPSPTLRYREPGPGMPGYRGSGNPYRGGDSRR